MKLRLRPRHENGQKQLEGNYKNGNRDGLWNRWHKNGQKLAEANYVNGKEGWRIEYDKEGEVIED